MPIYEYRCKNCQNKFDKLVPMNTGSSEIECPACHKKQAEKVISLFGTKESDNSSYATAGSCAPAPGGG